MDAPWLYSLYVSGRRWCGTPGPGHQYQEVWGSLPPGDQNTGTRHNFIITRSTSLRLTVHELLIIDTKTQAYSTGKV